MRSKIKCVKTLPYYHKETETIMSKYDFKTIEKKWQKDWEDKKCFEAKEDSKLPKFYALSMFIYPSGRVHMGHVRCYTIGDVVARYKCANGYNVLQPWGWDAFGLPAENAALERKVHPAKWTYDNIDQMRIQLKSIGYAFDWSREIATCDPSYYKHEQKMFLDFVKAGLAYRKESWVNWDPVDNTVLANEQVENGRGWRTGALVERRKLSQWFLKMTHYADDLLDELKRMPRWPERIRLMQENWIGKSRGAQFVFKLSGGHEDLEIFTTRPDTLFGASFVAISPHHPLANKLTEKNAKLKEFVAECDRIGTSEEALETAEKVGFDTGIKAEHPFRAGWQLPVYVANFVLMEYGTGAIFGCPAHDQRDLDFARKYKLPVKPVVIPEGEDPATFAVDKKAYTGTGKLRNSDFMDGMGVEEAQAAAIVKLEKLKRGKGTTMYRLRDWGISRQRYWGCPIPIIHCECCGVVPVPDDQLPVTLPDDVSFEKPGNPLEYHPTWKHIKCPKCSKKAQRETDTFDTFIDSSWYFLRYLDPRNEKQAFSKDKAKYWMPVDQYVGGPEHAVMHLLYARFWMRALKDCGYAGIEVKEPFAGLFCQGMVNHATYQDKDGKWLYPEEVAADAKGNYAKVSDGSPVTRGPVIKMSKSKRNTVEPMDMVEKYGSDSVRMFVLSDSPADGDMEWTEAGIDGTWRFLSRVWRQATEVAFTLPAVGAPVPSDFSAEATALRKQTHKTIKTVTSDIETFGFNTALAKLRELSNAMSEISGKGAGETWAYREALEALVQLISPITPHLAEEVWQQLGHKQLIVKTAWPVADEALAVDDTVTIGVQVNGKLRASITLPRNFDEETAKQTALADPAIQRAIEGKSVRKVIVVKNRIVNVVV